eukprot:GEZU01019928.1.p1 GENE.GEZU01019928.1~~GEZU01019928.1.p1  ORF type:complete len:522 (+),score=130.99 GEZU01019928.1:114-1568(+)
MFCSLSGTTPEEPVVSVKSGHLYEKRLIEKYIEANGTDPVTGQPLSKEDLIPVKTNQTLRPRPVNATSIPGMLALFQNEWDALMLETYTLKQHLETVRQELSHALYQHDAACRVIARLVRERDQARAALASANINAQAMEVEEGITPEIQKKMQETSEILSGQRKKRKVPATLAAASDFKNYVEISSHPLHKTTEPGILCIDLHPNNANLVLTGGNDGDATLFNRENGQIVATLSGHTKRINDVMFHPTRDVLFTASDDKTARTFIMSDDEKYKLQHTFTHAAPVTGVTLHPTHDYFVTCSMDKTWAFNDVNTGIKIYQSTTNEEIDAGYTCTQFHPDGLILGTGATDSVIRIWDMNSQENVATFKGHKKGSKITAISFSENGYYMASASDDSTVKLWDLRKLSNFHTIELESPVNSVRFDLSGSYLAATSADIRVYQSKVWTELGRLTKHTAAVTDVTFGPDAKFIASTSLDRTLRFFGLPTQ